MLMADLIIVLFPVIRQVFLHCGYELVQNNSS